MTAHQPSVSVQGIFGSSPIMVCRTQWSSASAFRHNGCNECWLASLIGEQHDTAFLTATLPERLVL